MHRDISSTVQLSGLGERRVMEAGGSGDLAAGNGQYVLTKINESIKQNQN